MCDVAAQRAEVTISTPTDQAATLATVN